MIKFIIFRHAFSIRGYEDRSIIILCIYTQPRSRFISRKCGLLKKICCPSTGSIYLLYLSSIQSRKVGGRDIFSRDWKKEGAKEEGRKVKAEETNYPERSRLDRLSRGKKQEGKKPRADGTLSLLSATQPSQPITRTQPSKLLIDGSGRLGVSAAGWRTQLSSPPPHPSKEG